MDILKAINYIFIVIGGSVAIYANAEEQQNEYLLITGVVMLMIGIYRVSRHIRSKSETIEEEKENKIDHEL